MNLYSDINVIDCKGVPGTELRGTSLIGGSERMWMDMLTLSRISTNFGDGEIKF